MIAFYVLATLGLVTKLYLIWENIQHIAKNQDQVPAAFSHKITLEDHQKAAKYTITKNKFNAITDTWHLALLFVWIPLGGLNWLNEMTIQFGQDELTSGIIFFSLYMLISIVISLPESLYSTFVIEENFGFNKTTPSIFIKDLFKQILIFAVIGLPLIYMILKIIGTLGDNWWLYGWTAMVAFQFLIMWAYPKFIAPLFNKFTPLSDEALKGEIEGLIQRCDLDFKDYYVMDASIRSSHGNAYFTGFGKNKRIVFFDTLLSTLSVKEVIAVLSHELGHLKHKHILKSMVTSIITLLVGFFVLGVCYKSEIFFSAHGIEQKSSYMAIMLFMFLAPLYTFFLTPLMSWKSRKNEYEADAFASKYANGDDLISSLIQMYKDNSSSLTPGPQFSKFYYSHPPAFERVNYINSLKK